MHNYIHYESLDRSRSRASTGRPHASKCAEFSSAARLARQAPTLPHPEARAGLEEVAGHAARTKRYGVWRCVVGARIERIRGFTASSVCPPRRGRLCSVNGCYRACVATTCMVSLPSCHPKQESTEASGVRYGSGPGRCSSIYSAFIARACLEDSAQALPRESLVMCGVAVDR